LAATALLRGGATLDMVGAVLRHLRRTRPHIMPRSTS
jgi:hypothetical protein